MRRTFPAEPVEPVEHVEPVKPNASGLLGDSRKTIHADGTLNVTWRCALWGTLSGAFGATPLQGLLSLLGFLSFEI